MEWLSFFGHRRPINGQKIIYYGEPIGVWRGKYLRLAIFFQDTA
jgi:hypothetical protein